MLFYIVFIIYFNYKAFFLINFLSITYYFLLISTSYMYIGFIIGFVNIIAYYIIKNAF